MKVETPQILWNCDSEKGKNAPLLSIDMIQSGFVTGNDPTQHSHVLVTAGNATSINVWKVQFHNNENSDSNNNAGSGIFQKQALPSTTTSTSTTLAVTSSTTTAPANKPPTYNNIEYMLSLNRHDVPVNCIKFSPNGLHLVTGGDSGSLVVWSIPLSKRGNSNGHHYWSLVEKESQLNVKILSCHCEGITDISWSSDSKRFIVGTIDSNLLVYEDKNHSYNASNPETHQRDSDWSLIYRNGDHGSFVQGVSYDPLGVYMTSMSNDRIVRIFPRKIPPKSKKKVLRPTNSNNKKAVVTPSSHDGDEDDHHNMVQQILTENKIDVGKIKRIKQRIITVEEQQQEQESHVVEEDQGQPNTTSTVTTIQQRQMKQKLFVDESNCESFFRRLNWTTDGAFLITPAALYHKNDNTDPTFATYLFARHRFDEPYRVLPGLKKPSVVVRANPILFELPQQALQDTKENQVPSTDDENEQQRATTNLPYRSIFAVLTLDTILIYDTYHLYPLSVISGLHYAGLTDCCWSNDGKNLLVCSSDGYISIINFVDGELGTVYNTHKSKKSIPSNIKNGTTVSEQQQHQQQGHDVSMPPPDDIPPLPPCETGPTNVVMAPPPKRAKKMRITPTLVSTTTTNLNSASKLQDTMTTTNMAVSTTSKRNISDTETETVGEAVTKLSLDTSGHRITTNQDNNGSNVDFRKKTNNSFPQQEEENPKKKKKRVQPVLISQSNH